MTRPNPSTRSFVCEAARMLPLGRCPRSQAGNSCEHHTDLLQPGGMNTMPRLHFPARMRSNILAMTR